MIEKLGGRKFLTTLIAMIIGTAVQLLSQKGVTPEFAALLATLVTAFGAANVFATASVPAPLIVDGEEKPGEMTLEVLSQVADQAGKQDQTLAAHAQAIDEMRSEVTALAGSVQQAMKTSEVAAKVAKAAFDLRGA